MLEKEVPPAAEEVKKRTFEDELENNGVLSSVERQAIITAHSGKVDKLKQELTFNDVYLFLYKRTKVNEDPYNRFLPINRYLLLADASPTIGNLHESKLDHPRLVRVEADRIVIEGSKLNFDPDQILAGCLTAEKVGAEMRVMYPHLDSAGKLRGKTILLLQPETLSSVGLTAIEAVVKKNPFTRTIPETLTASHYSWLSSRFNEIRRLLDTLGLDAKLGAPLDKMPIGAVLNAAWEPNAESSKLAFKTLYDVLSKPPFEVFLNYLDCIEMKRNVLSNPR